MMIVAEFSDYKPDFTSIDGIREFGRCLDEHRVELAWNRVNKDQLVQFKETTEITWPIFSQMLGITLRTLHTQKLGRFNSKISERVVGLLHFLSYGYYKFIDPQLFNRWLRTGSPETGYTPPYILYKQGIGYQQLVHEIDRLSKISTNLFQHPRKTEFSDGDEQ